MAARSSFEMGLRCDVYEWMRRGGVSPTLARVLERAFEVHKLSDTPPREGIPPSHSRASMITLIPTELLDCLRLWAKRHNMQQTSIARALLSQAYERREETDGATQ